MSALPPKADICSALADVRFGPKADIGLSGPCPAQPMPARSSECCHQHLSEDWRVCAHAMRHADPRKEIYSSSALALGRQGMASSNHQSCGKSWECRLAELSHH